MENSKFFTLLAVDFQVYVNNNRPQRKPGDESLESVLGLPCLAQANQRESLSGASCVPIPFLALCSRTQQKDHFLKGGKGAIPGGHREQLQDVE